MSLSTKTKSKWFDLRRLYESSAMSSSCVTKITEWILHLLKISSSYVNRFTRRFIVKESHFCWDSFLLMISERLYSLWRQKNAFSSEFKKNDLCRLSWMILTLTLTKNTTFAASWRFLNLVWFNKFKILNWEIFSIFSVTRKKRISLILNS